MSIHTISTVWEISIWASGYRAEVMIYMIMPEYVGVCNDNPIEGSWQDRSLGIVKRIKLKESFKGLLLRTGFIILTEILDLRRHVYAQ